MADKLKTAFIGSVDEQGYPNVKAISLIRSVTVSDFMETSKKP